MGTITVTFGKNTQHLPTKLIVVRDQRWHRMTEKWPGGREGVWFWATGIKRRAPGKMALEVAFKGAKNVVFMQRVNSEGNLRYGGMPSFPLLVTRNHWPLKIRVRQKPIRKTEVILRIAYQ